MTSRRSPANPFNIPADEDIFRHREEDRQLKAELRAVALQQSVAAKTTFASRMQATTTADAKAFLKQYRTQQKDKAELTLAASASAPDRRKDKENMTDFIAKKREIFLLQVCVGGEDVQAGVGSVDGHDWVWDAEWHLPCPWGSRRASSSSCFSCADEPGHQARRDQEARGAGQAARGGAQEERADAGGGRAAL